MNCETFRTFCRQGQETPAMLEHLRSCASCVEAAVEADPEYLFRSIGGSDLIPPGGVDLFVDEVMQQISVRQAEAAAVRRPRMAVWRWAAAAAVLVGLFSLSVLNRPAVHPTAPVAPVAAVHKPQAALPLVTRPAVESYESPGATIVEVPTDQNQNDVKIVMVFDESLPADL